MSLSIDNQLFDQNYFGIFKCRILSIFVYSLFDEKRKPIEKK